MLDLKTWWNNGGLTEEKGVGSARVIFHIGDKVFNLVSQRPRIWFWCEWQVHIKCVWDSHLEKEGIGGKD